MTGGPQENLRRILSNLGAQLASQVFIVAAGLAFIIIISRKLGPERFGIYQFCISFPLLFTSLIPLGMDIYFPRDLAQDPQKAKDYATNGVPVTMINTLGFYVLIILASIALNYDAQYTRCLFISGGAAALVGAYLLPGAFFRGFELLKFDAALNSGEKLISFCAGLVLLFIWNSIYALLAGLLLGQLARVIISFVYLRQLVGNFTFRFNLKKTFALIGPGVPLLIAAYASIFNNNIGMAFLGKVGSRTDLGYYGMAWQVLGLAMMGGVAVSNATYPFVARKTLEAKSDLKELLEKVLPLFFFFALLVSCGVAVSAKSLIRVIFGHGYIDGSFFLSTMAVAIPSVLVKYLLGNILISSYAQRAILIILLISATIIAALNLLLVPYLGGIGAVIAFIIADYIITLGFIITLSSLGFFQNWQGLGKAVLGVAVIFLAYSALSPFTGKNMAVSIFPLAMVLGIIMVVWFNQESNKRIIELIR